MPESSLWKFSSPILQTLGGRTVGVSHWSQDGEILVTYIKVSGGPKLRICRALIDNGNVLMSEYYTLTDDGKSLGTRMVRYHQRILQCLDSEKSTTNS